jgi:sugar lactone lactonase YvrE
MKGQALAAWLASLSLLVFGAAAAVAEVSPPRIGTLPPGWVVRTNLGIDERLEGGKNLWTIGSAALDPSDDTRLVVSPEGDQWVNTGAGGLDMHTLETYGDVHAEFEVMLPRNGNSGFYLCGEYEVQIWDSYGKKDLAPNQEFGNIPFTHDPYVRAEKAPGEWQRFVIDFRAPRFDGAGNKVRNAVFERVTLNGLLIHENVEVPAPTRVGLTGREAPEGPIMIQGFVGQVAFRNVRIERRPAVVHELPYEAVDGFFKLPAGKNLGETSAVAVAQDGHVFVFNRGPDPVVEFDAEGRYLQAFGHGIAPKAHGMRIDRHDHLWLTDVATHVVLRLDRQGRVTMVLGRHNRAGAEPDLFDQPTDVGFGPNDEIFVTDGYGNSRVVKFDKDGNFLEAWGGAGNGPGQFKTPHTIVVDGERRRVYVGDRDNFRTQVFDLDGNFVQEWTTPGAPWGFALARDGTLFMADGYAERVVHVSPDGRALGAFGSKGKGPGRFHFAHAVGLGSDGALFVAEIRNWRAQKFVPRGWLRGAEGGARAMR